MGLLNKFRHSPHRRVQMVNSVGEFAGGETYDIPMELADQFIARGYARGEYSQPYTEDDLAVLRGNLHQTVQL